ncbi:hypothetical protein F5148DRAFT_1278747 [Russula earlei]|uniref:Uncharacterized protein n=1 Tax=Russula earlei TaxID=71964 RepID=A0ACC0TQ44_9AGAM|nr:hypothetical protein F5148DRAFT_1278747 [Russula earlei]
MTKFDQLLSDGVSLPTPQSRSGGLTKPFNRNSSLKSNNCNALSPARQRNELAGSVSVARVRPRTSKGITDLLLPQTSVS